MIKYAFLFSLVYGFLIIQADLYADIPPNKNFVANDVSSFEKKMDEAIGRAEQDVQKLQYNATRRDMAPTWNTKLELQNGIIQLDVKKTLVNNFKGTESLKSALVQEKLLQVLNKPFITTADLADLQSLVIQEKSRMNLENQSNSTAPATSPSFSK